MHQLDNKAKTKKKFRSFATTVSWALCTHLALGDTIHGCHAVLVTAQWHHTYTSSGCHFVLVALDWLGQCSWIPRDSVSEPIGCSTPLATSFMPIHGIVYCLLYYPSCTKVARCQVSTNTRAENVPKDHTVHDIVIADRLRQRQGIPGFS